LHAIIGTGLSGWLILAAALSVPRLSILPQPAQQPSMRAAPIVRTAEGELRGMTPPSGVRTFRGIPFAAPPVRDLRWKPPQPPGRWQGVRVADRFASQCMQARVFSDMMFPIRA
jgi:para-nitrobenzyl esterase